MGTQAEENSLKRLVVTDTGPIIHLMEANALELLNMIGTISIPQAVHQEVITAIGIEAVSKLTSIQVKPLKPDAAQSAFAWQASGILHLGEAESIALAIQVSSDWYLTDDAAARLVASSLGIEVHGSLGIVLWAAATGHISRKEAELSLDGLAQSSLWVSQRILNEAYLALESIYVG